MKDKTSVSDNVMKIYVIGSSRFAPEMVAARDHLRALGHDGWIHPDYELIARGEKTNISSLRTSQERSAHKKKNNYLRVHYKHICESDAVLVVNLERDGQKNYIGGNVLIEMGQAYVNNKKIFLLNDIPAEAAYVDEIEAMEPMCLHGDLHNLKQHTGIAITPIPSPKVR